MTNIQSPELHKKELFRKLISKELTLVDAESLNENTPDLNENEAIKSFKTYCKIQLRQKKEAQEALQKFNLSSWDEVNKNPHNFKLIKRVQFSENPGDYPHALKPLIGDEISIVFLDFETTGLSHQTDEVIELGIVKVKYSPSEKRMTEISLVRSEYNDPERDIPQEITEITGIKDADVKNKKIDVKQVKEWIGSEENTYIIAHNSKFDRPFFTKLMGTDNYKWGCSASQIDWKAFKEYRIESAKLEYILLKLGYFYGGHRASVDCLAMVQMFFILPEALEQLLQNIDQNSVIIEAIGAPFDIKDPLKHAGYRWNAEKKTWWIEVPESKLEEYLTDLGKFGNYKSSNATQVPLTARERFK